MAISPPNTGNPALNGYLADLQELIDILDSKSIPEEGWSLSDLSAEVSETISDERDIIDVANTAVAKLNEVKELASDLRAFSMGLLEAKDFKASAESLLDWYDQNEISIQALLEMTSGSNGAADLIESFDLIRAAVETSATKAKASETAAKTSQTAAKTSETNAKTSETNAKASEDNAKASETAAASSKSAAASSASSASSSKTAAANSATAAAASATQADNIANSTSWSGDKVTINGKTSPSLTGPQGPAPTLQAGSAQKLAPGSNPTVALTEGAGGYSLEVGVPVGERGLPGQAGITNSTAGVTSYDPVVIDLKPYLVEGVTASRFSLIVAGSTATLTVYDLKNSNTGAAILPSSAFPAEYRPKADLAGPCFIREGTATTVTNSAFWTLYTTGTMNHWRSGSGLNGYGWVATWSVAAPVLHANTASILDGAVTPAKLSQAYATPGYVDTQVSTRTLPETVSTMISTAISDLVGSAPAALDTVYELAAYLTDSTVANGIVQQLAGKANSTHTHTKAQVTDLQTISTAATANQIPLRTTGGAIIVPTTPTATTYAASKSYVDTQVATKANTSHTHVATDIATSFAAQPSTIPIRDSEGHLAATSPAAPGQVATKNYVDTRPALFSGAGGPPASIAGAVVGDYWLNETTMELSKITGV